jgi:hypothetical protein
MMFGWMTAQLQGTAMARLSDRKRPMMDDLMKKKGKIALGVGDDDQQRTRRGCTRILQALAVDANDQVGSRVNAEKSDGLNS